MVDQNLNEMVNQGSSENEFFVDCLYIENTSSKYSSACFSVVNINGNTLRMKLDTGVSANMISWKTVSIILLPRVHAMFV